MKKFYLFAAALFAAVTINAKEIVVDLSDAAKITNVETANAAYANGELAVEWTVAAAYGVAGIEISLNNIADISGISFEINGDGSGIGIIHYLRDAEGNRWWDSSKWVGLPATWTTVSAVPSACLWDGATYPYGQEVFTKIGIIANPSTAGSGTFYLRNIVLTVPDDATAIDNIAAQGKAVKVIRNGQVFIVRDGKTYNALGAEVK